MRPYGLGFQRSAIAEKYEARRFFKRGSARKGQRELKKSPERQAVRLAIRRGEC